MRIVSFAVVIVMLAVASPVVAASWRIDPSHSRIGFAVKHLMIQTVRGQFNTFMGTVDIDDKDVTKSKVEVTIDAGSIDTNDGKRDGHLRSADFFDVEKNSKLVFKSTSVRKGADGKLQVSGDLTMRGVTKPVVLTITELSSEVNSPWGGVLRAASAQTTISRKDWDLTWNKALETGGVLVSDEVKLDLDLELVKN